jgi:hypothetical protein
VIVQQLPEYPERLSITKWFLPSDNDKANGYNH